jgi:hypothetical protein
MLPNVEAWNHSKWIFQYLTLPVSCFLVNQVCHCGVDFMTFLPLLNFDLGLERQHTSSENLRGSKLYATQLPTHSTKDLETNSSLGEDFY